MPNRTSALAARLKDDVDACRRRNQGLSVEHVAADEPKTRIPDGLLEEALLAGREIVVRNDLVSALEEAIHEMATDEAGSARD